MTEHTIYVKSLQEWRGSFTTDFIEDGVLSDEGMLLQFESEVSLVFQCDCGEKFHKQKTAVEHLEEVTND